MNSLKCKECSASLLKTDKKCPFCGSEVDFIEEVSQDTTPVSVDNKEGEIDVFILVVLILLFWPGAIIYVIVQNNAKNKRDEYLKELKHLLENDMISNEEYNNRKNEYLDYRFKETKKSIDKDV